MNKNNGLLNYLFNAGFAYQRKSFMPFVLGPILIEPFLLPIYQAWRQEHNEFYETYLKKKDLSGEAYKEETAVEIVH